MKKYVLAIDPGTLESGICLVQTEDIKPIAFAKIENTCFENWLVRVTTENKIRLCDIECVIERMQGRYNGSVGAETFLTCEWIGRFDTILEKSWYIPVGYVKRSEEYRQLCGKLYPHNDAGVKAALVDMFAYGVANYGKGNKKSPGWFYGFSKDVWSAYAQATSWVLMNKDKEEN